jgi:di/tricarboxylate transporter
LPVEFPSGLPAEFMAITIVIAILVLAIGLFITEVLPIDLVAMLMLLSLALTGILTPAEAFAGFSDPAVITIIAFFVLSAALFNTGVVESVGRRLHEIAGTNRTTILLVVMLTAAAIAAFMSNVVTTAVLMPAVIGLARRRKHAASLYLMPLAFGAVLGGKCTLAGSATNLAVNGLLPQYGMPPFTLFEFAPLGIPLVIAGTAFMALIGVRLLPAHTADEDTTEEQRAKSYLTEVIVREGSPLVGRSLGDVKLRDKFDLQVIALTRANNRSLPFREIVLEAGDVLSVKGKLQKILDIKEAQGLDLKSDKTTAPPAVNSDVPGTAVDPSAAPAPAVPTASDTSKPATIVVEALLAPNSAFAGRTLKEIHFRSRYGTDVLGHYRHQQALYDRLEEIPLRVGDLLIIQGSPARIDSLREDPNFITLDDVEHTPLRRRKAAWAVGIFVLTALAAGFNIAPIALLALTAAVAVVMVGCISIREAYTRVEWTVIVLIAGTIPMGLAMEKTGAARLLAQYVTEYLGRGGPILVLGGFFLFAIVLTQAMVNAAAALLLTPIALNVAQQLQVNPRAFAVTIAIAASTSFATPLEPACAIVYGPGRYHFRDFTRVGGLLTLLLLLVTLLIVPLWWPLR